MYLKGQPKPTQLLSEVDQGSTHEEGQIFLYACSHQHYYYSQKVEATRYPSIDDWINKMWSTHALE